MAPAPLSELLLKTLRDAQRLGFFGPGSLDGPIDQARRFCDALPAGTSTVLDVGSGGGLPSLVVLEANPAVRMYLVERRLTRADFLQRAIRRLGWIDRVVVATCDVRQAGSLFVDELPDVVMARGLASPEKSAELIRPLLGGSLVVSVNRVNGVDLWREQGFLPQADFGDVVRFTDAQAL